LICWIGIGEAMAHPKTRTLLEKIKNHAAIWEIDTCEQSKRLTGTSLAVSFRTIGGIWRISISKGV
jgi:hypothetical protein